MRSRYSAYALGLAEYLLSTWHPTTRPATLELTDGLRWLGLEVGPHTQQSRTQATVEFVARYEGPDGPNVLHEVSRFLKEGERWYYVDGQFPDAPAE